MTKSKRRSRNRLYIGIAVLFLCILSCGGIFVISRNAVTPKADFAIERVQTRDVTRVVTVDGNFQGKVSRDILYPTGAKVIDAYVSVGSRVNRDQEVAEIETISTFGYKKKEKIKSPITGVVVARNYGDGETVTSSPIGFTLVDISSYEIKALINENEIIDIKAKQDVNFTVPAVSLDKLYKGKVKSIAPAPSSTTGAISYEVRITPSTFPEKIRLGMSADIEIITGKVDDTLAIPDSFLIERDDKFFVKFITDVTKTPIETTDREVKIGLRTDQYVEVKSGLKQGDQIIEPSFTAARSFGLFGAGNSN